MRGFVEHARPADVPRDQEHPRTICKLSTFRSRTFFLPLFENDIDSVDDCSVDSKGKIAKHRLPLLLESFETSLGGVDRDGDVDIFVAFAGLRYALPDGERGERDRRRSGSDVRFRRGSRGVLQLARSRIRPIQTMRTDRPVTRACVRVRLQRHRGSRAIFAIVRACIGTIGDRRQNATARNVLDKSTGGAVPPVDRGQPWRYPSSRQNRRHIGQGARVAGARRPMPPLPKEGAPAANVPARAGRTAALFIKPFLSGWGLCRAHPEQKLDQNRGVHATLVGIAHVA